MISSRNRGGQPERRISRRHQSSRRAMATTVPVSALASTGVPALYIEVEGNNAIVASSPTAFGRCTTRQPSSMVNMEGANRSTGTPRPVRDSSCSAIRDNAAIECGAIGRAADTEPAPFARCDPAPSQSGAATKMPMQRRREVLGEGAAAWITELYNKTKQNAGKGPGFVGTSGTRERISVRGTGQGDLPLKLQQDSSRTMGQDT